MDMCELITCENGGVLTTNHLKRRILVSKISPQFASIFLSLLEKCLKNESVNWSRNDYLFCSFDFPFDNVSSKNFHIRLPLFRQ